MFAMSWLPGTLYYGILPTNIGFIESLNHLFTASYRLMSKITQIQNELAVCFAAMFVETFSIASLFS
jgi:hypothetical protein